MSIALIFAGGTGTRMNLDSMPKQFLEVDHIPIIIHTIKHFEQHPSISDICIVCLSSGISYLNDLLQKFQIRKVRWIVEGGQTGQDSIRNGLFRICQEIADDIILIHDGVRPLIDKEIISNCITCVERNRTAVTVVPAIETIITVGEQQNIEEIHDRQSCKIARAPQCFYLKDIVEAHKQAMEEEKNDFIDSALLMSHYGYQISTVEGPMENIKITTPIDYEIFKAIYQTNKMKGIE